MKNTAKQALDGLTDRYPRLSVCNDSVHALAETLIKCYKNGGKLLICGNGGSAADALHIAGELMKGYRSRRPLGKEEKRELKKII